MAKVTLDNLAAEVGKMLDEYADEVTDNVKEATHKVALLTVRALQSESRQAVNGKKYYRGWRTYSETTRLSQKETIYNSKLPGLPHLLEYGHALRNGGRTAARIHIAPVEAEAEKMMTQELEARLK